MSVDVDVGTVETPLQRFASDFAQSKVAVAGLCTIVFIIFIAIFAPLLSAQNPYDLGQLDIMDGRLPPGEKGGMGFTFWLGSDDQGRDMLSGIFYGLRTSLGVGASSALIALFIGSSVGLLAAYFGGRVDSLIMRIVDIQLSFPAVLVALVLLAILGKGVDKIIIALVAVQWAYYARTVRGTALVERSKEYMEAARCLALRPPAHHFSPPFAQLHAAVDCGGNRAGGLRHIVGSYPVVSRPRPAGDRAVFGPADCQWL